MDLSLRGKRALVCGSTDGIGKATALLLADRGAEIILMARNKQKLAKTCAQLSTEFGQKHSMVCADFNTSTEVKNAISTRLNENIHILVNNSGGPHGGELLNDDENEFRIAFERLVIANQIITQAIASKMKKNGYGRIINIISISVNQVIKGLGVSNTIRGAVAQWAKTLALELGPFGITVNNILPGYTSTERLKELSTSKAKELDVTPKEIESGWANNTSLKRLGKPEEIGSAVAFLASSSASYINGYNMAVDGGRIGT